uniref:Uncharacterized protein n=1 Tax=Timema tahoe TaxID=61484 RepID=A0A7R9NXV2_9NEOP|nr:unnamed protein product [Timema tahoe]
MEEMGLPVLELIQFVDTRWSSEYNMLSRLHAVRKAVGAELANSENNIEVLTAVEWKQAAGIVEVLGPLADATKEISGDSYPTSSMVIPILHCLKSHLNVFITSKKDGVMFARSLDKALKSRFSFYDSDPIFCPSMLCDPRFRGVLIDDMVAVNTLAIEVKKLSDKSSLEPNEAVDLLEDELDTEDPVRTSHGELHGEQLLYQQYRLLFPYHGVVHPSSSLVPSGEVLVRPTTPRLHSSSTRDTPAPQESSPPPTAATSIDLSEESVTLPTTHDSDNLVVESFESEQEKEEEDDQSESCKSPVTAQTSGGDTEGGTIAYKLESEIGKIEDSFEQSKEPNSSPFSEDG